MLSLLSRRQTKTSPPVSYAAQGEATSPKFAAAFARGCGGIATGDISQLLKGDFAAFCTPAVWPLLDRARREGRRWYYGDHAYFRRGKYYRIGKNAVQYVPTLADLASATPDRLRACHVDVAPEWHRDGAAIVVCPNSPIYMQRFGYDAHQWVLSIVDQLGSVTDRPIVIRWKAQAQKRPLYLDLHNAWAVVVFSSGAAVEALTAGIPVFVLAPWSSAASMGLSDLARIETPFYPDNREPFLWALAEHQWTLPEIASGMAWRALHA